MRDSERKEKNYRLIHTLVLNNETSRLARLVAILTQLQAKRLLTSTQLAARFNVSVRTIYRDMRTLEQAGVPIITEEGRGYSVVEGYRLPPHHVHRSRSQRADHGGEIGTR